MLTAIILIMFCAAETSPLCTTYGERKNIIRRQHRYVFFFKQKPAYEIIVCLEFRRVLFRSAQDCAPLDTTAQRVRSAAGDLGLSEAANGRAACRGREEISVGAPPLKKKR